MVELVPIDDKIVNTVHLRGFADRQPWAGQMPAGGVLFGTPTIRIFRDSKVLKPSVQSVGGKVTYRAAMYDGNGGFIEETSVLRGTTENLFEPISSNLDTPRLSKLDGDYLFCGWNFGHFGHFLTETLPAAWAASLFPKDVTPLMLNPSMIPFTDNEIKLLKASGVDPFSIQSVRSDSLISHLLVPSRMFRPRTFVAHELSTIMLRTGQNLMGESSRPRLDKIYISRRALNSPTRVVENEHSVEQFFTSRGFFVVHPELIPIEEQLYLFANCKMIGGVAGSFFHLAPLAASNALRIELSGPVINGNLVLTDVISGGQTVYVNCLVPSGPSGRMIFEPHNLEAACREFAI